MAIISDVKFADRLLKDLADRASVDGESGQVTFSAGGSFDEQRLLLFDLLHFDLQIPTEDASAIARDALFAAAGPPGLTLDRFTDELSKIERVYLSRRPQRHVLLSQVSIDARAVLPRMTEDGVTISFPQSVPGPFLLARQYVLDHGVHSLYVDPPKKYRWLRASVTAKSHMAAGNRALEAVEFRLALLNLGINRQTGIRWSSGRRKPVNSIALAPLHSLHRPDGSLSSETWWYEPNYVHPSDIESRRIGSALEFSASALSQLRRLRYAKEFKDWVCYYGHALGQSDWAVSFILLWQALESTTGTSRAKYESTVRRASFLFDDVEYSKRVLDSLRNCRNELVHAQNDPTDLETRLYILKRYVEAALVFHLSHAGDFESVEEACQFLDLPSSARELDKRLRMVKKAAKFRGL